MDIRVGDAVITDDDARWQICSITLDGRQRSFVAVHVSSPRALCGNVTNLIWSGTESAWRFRLGGGQLSDHQKG
jgi:hypothetical protein